MKKILKVFLSLFLFACMLMLSACGFSDIEFGNSGAIGGIGSNTENQRPNLFADIAGYKVCYRPNSYPFRDYYYNISNILLNKLYSTYGMAGMSLQIGNDEIDEKLIEKLDQNYKNEYNIIGEIDKTETRYIKFRNEYLVYYCDDVRYSIYVLKNLNGEYTDATGNVLSDQNAEHYFFAHKGEQNKWLWNSPSNSSDVDFATSKACFDGLYSSTPLIAKNALNYVAGNDVIKNATKKYYSEIVSEFTPALQTAILQIVLGITPQTFTLDDINSGVISNILGTSEMRNGEIVATGLKLKFQQEATYVGLTDADKTKIENYILDNVIGQNKISSEGKFTREDYLSTIREVWEEEILIVDEVENSSTTYGMLFQPYPATLIKDYNENTFFISSKKGEAFKDIPQMQYQSIVIMPEKEIYLWELWLVFAGESNLNINTYFRYYNKTNNTLTIGKPKKATTILESEFDAFKSPYYSISIDDNGKESLFYLDEFNNDIGGGILNTKGESVLMTGDISKFYTLIDSANGYSTVTVLNADMFNTQNGCSYLEIVFDVENQLDLDKDKSFKVALSGAWLGTNDMIEDYKMKNNIA